MMDDLQKTDLKKRTYDQVFFRHLKILSFTGKILLSILLAIISLAIIWGFIAWIPIEAFGRGVTISQKGLFQVLAKTDGVILDIPVKTGEKVKKGDLLVELYNPQEELKLQSVNIKLENLENEYKQLKNQITLEEESAKKALNSEIQSNNAILEQIEQEIQSLPQDLKHSSDAQQTEFAIIQHKIDRESVLEKLAILKADLAKEYRAEELRNKEREVEQEKNELSVLQSEMQNEKIFSPHDGTVTSILNNAGKLVKIGDPLLLLEELSDNLNFVIYGYFPIETAKDIERGTPVEIEFTHLRENEYGRMLGVVQSISDYSASAEHLQNTIYNKDLIKRLLANNSAALEVIILPSRDPNNPTEYLWSSGKTPRVDITTGTFCLLYATVEEKKPIYFIFPFEGLKRSPHLTIEK